MQFSKISAGTLLLFAYAIGGCAWLGDHKPQIQQTAIVVAERAASIAGEAVLSAAISQYDADKKADWLDALAAGFRSNMGTVVSSEDVKKIVAIWTPDKPQWKNLGDQFATLWTQYQPHDDASMKAFLEAYAKACNQAAATARTQ